MFGQSSTSSGSGSQSQLFAILVQVSHLASRGPLEEFPYSSLESSFRAAFLDSVELPTANAIERSPLEWSGVVLMRGKSLRLSVFIEDLAGGGRFLFCVVVAVSVLSGFLFSSRCFTQSSLGDPVLETKIKEHSNSQHAGAMSFFRAVDTVNGPAVLILFIEHQPCDARVGSRQLQSLAQQFSQ